MEKSVCEQMGSTRSLFLPLFSFLVFLLHFQHQRTMTNGALLRRVQRPQLAMMRRQPTSFPEGSGDSYQLPQTLNQSSLLFVFLFLTKKWYLNALRTLILKNEKPGIGWRLLAGRENKVPFSLSRNFFSPILRYELHINLSRWLCWVKLSIYKPPFYLFSSPTHASLSTSLHHASSLRVFQGFSWEGSVDFFPPTPVFLLAEDKNESSYILSQFKLAWSLYLDLFKRCCLFFLGGDSWKRRVNERNPCVLERHGGAGSRWGTPEKNTRRSYGVALMMYPSIPDHGTYHLAR